MFDPASATLSMSGTVPTVTRPELLEVRFHRKTSRKVVAASLALAAAAVLAAASPTAHGLHATTLARVEPAADALLARHQFVGTARRDGVLVRSGPSVGDLSVLSLRADQEVVVVGMRHNFLRILPPDGSFCMVPKARVNVSGDVNGPRTGRVVDPLSVRVGSALNATIASTALRLAPGDLVEVLDEDAVYYKIKPPVGVFLYVDQEDLRKARQVEVAEGPGGWVIAEAPDPATQAAAEGQIAASGLPEVTRTPEPASTPGPVAVADQDDGDEAPGTADAAPEPAPDDEPAPSPAADRLAEFNARFSDIDSDYEEAAALPLDQQPLSDLATRYQVLRQELADDESPAASVVLPLVDARLKTIDVRKAALEDLKAIQAMRESINRQQQILAAEQAELRDLRNQGQVVMYKAVGELHTSSLQTGNGVLFRLCDPEDGRTLVYVRAEGQLARDLAGQVGRFVGVKGEINRDPSLGVRFVGAETAVALPVEALFDSAAAELIPNSLLERFRNADLDDELTADVGRE